MLVHISTVGRSPVMGTEFGDLLGQSVGQGTEFGDLTEPSPNRLAQERPGAAVFC